MAGRRAETSRESRLMLLTAASELFAERGFQQTTFADLAERAGISRGSITWHFGNKQGLLMAVLEQETNDFIDLLDRVEAMQPGEIEGFLEAEVAAGTLLRSTKLFLGLYTEAIKPDSVIRDAFTELHTRARQSLQQWAEQHLAIPGGGTSFDVAVALFGAAIGVNLQWLMAPELVSTTSAYSAMRLIIKPMVK